jgi:hypothetical protein
MGASTGAAEQGPCGSQWQLRSSTAVWERAGTGGPGWFTEPSAPQACQTQSQGQGSACSATQLRVRAGTAGAPVGADGGQSAPRAGQRGDVPTGNSAGTVHSLRQKSGWYAGCMPCPVRKTCCWLLTKAIQMHKTLYFFPNILIVYISNILIVYMITTAYSCRSRTATGPLLSALVFSLTTLYMHVVGYLYLAR